MTNDDTAGPAGGASVKVLRAALQDAKDAADGARIAIEELKGKHSQVFEALRLLEAEHDTAVGEQYDIEETLYALTGERE